MSLRKLADRLYGESKDLVKNLKEMANLNKEQVAWLVGGVSVYAAPALFRAVTKITEIFPHFYELPWYLPPNIIEKGIVNSFFPGATASVVIGDTKWKPYRSFIKSLSKKIGLEKYEKFVGRFTGAAIGTTLWTAFQAAGYVQDYLWPHGGNAFEDPSVYPFNIAIGLASTLVPYGVEKLKSRLLDGVKPYSLLSPPEEDNNMLSGLVEE